VDECKPLLSGHPHAENPRASVALVVDVSLGREALPEHAPLWRGVAHALSSGGSQRVTILLVAGENVRAIRTKNMPHAASIPEDCVCDSTRARRAPAVVVTPRLATNPFGISTRRLSEGRRRLRRRGRRRRGGRAWWGLPDIARHVTGCHLTQEARFKMRVDEVRGNVYQISLATSQDVT